MFRGDKFVGLSVGVVKKRLSTNLKKVAPISNDNASATGVMMQSTINGEVKPNCKKIELISDVKRPCVK